MAIGAAPPHREQLLSRWFRNQLVLRQSRAYGRRSASAPVIGIFLCRSVAFEATSLCGGLWAVLTVYGIEASNPGMRAVMVLKSFAGVVVIGGLFGRVIGLLKFPRPLQPVPAITFWLRAAGGEQTQPI